MEPYKGYLIDEYSAQEPLSVSGGDMHIPNTILTTVWKTRIINPVDGSITQAKGPKDAKIVIDEWSAIGNPEEIDKVYKEIAEKEASFETLDLEIGEKIKELRLTLQKARTEIDELKKTVPARSQW